MTLRPADLLGLPAADLVHDVALFRYVMVVLAVAWALVVARAKPVVAVASGGLYALVAAGFWVTLLGRPYGLFADPAVTRRVAECAVAAASGGWEGILSGEPARGIGAWLGRHGIAPPLLMLGPTLLAPLVVPVVGQLLYHFWSRRDRAWVGALLWLAFASGDLDALRGPALLPGLWAHPLGALGFVATAGLVLVGTRDPRGRRWVVAGMAVFAAWLGAGLFWAAVGESVTPLGPFARASLVTLDQGLWLPLGWYGLLRRGEPASRALVLAGLALFVLPLGVEPWGPLALYRLGLILAAAAPAAELCTFAGRRLKEAQARLAEIPDVRVGAAAALLALAPGSFPVWWPPVQLDAVFAESLDPVPTTVAEVADAVRAHTPPSAVVLAGREYAPAVAALAGRRVLRAPALAPAPDDGARWKAEERTLAGRPDAPAARPYGVTHVLMAIGDFAEHGLTSPEELASLPGFELVWQHAEGIRLYAVRPIGQPPGRR
jgi:hypothetical protein